MYTIYKYTNKINGKIYIGQTSKTLEERSQYNGRNYKGSRRFYNAIQKYSWESFVPEILEVVDTVEEANKREQYYIDLYDSRNQDIGYNIAFGGDNHIATDETRALISKNAKERYKDKTKNPMYGKKHTADSKKKQSECKRGELNPMYGSTWTEKQRACSGTKGKKLNITDENRARLIQQGYTLGEANKKKVLCVTDNNRFDSIGEASAYYGMPLSTLSYHLNGHSKTCRGMKFQYA